MTYSFTEQLTEINQSVLDNIHCNIFTFLSTQVCHFCLVTALLSFSLHESACLCYSAITLNELLSRNESGLSDCIYDKDFQSARNVYFTIWFTKKNIPLTSSIVKCPDPLHIKMHNNSLISVSPPVWKRPLCPTWSVKIWTFLLRWKNSSLKRSSSQNTPRRWSTLSFSDKKETKDESLLVILYTAEALLSYSMQLSIVIVLANTWQLITKYRTTQTIMNLLLKVLLPVSPISC